MTCLDLNCDLGEGEPRPLTRRLLRWINSCNIACGGHAGDLDSMRFCLRTASALGVHAGAHPGLPDAGTHGRVQRSISPREFESLLLHQISAFELLARTEQVPFHHIKLHGALYHQVEKDSDLAARFIRLVRDLWPSQIIYALAGGTLATRARRAGLTVYHEAFADRAYNLDGSLVPRSEPDAILTSPQKIVEQADLIASQCKVRTCSGHLIDCRADTLCIHGDTRNALAALRLIQKRFGDKTAPRRPTASNSTPPE